MILYVGFKTFEMEGIIFKEIYKTLQDMKFLSDIKKMCDIYHSIPDQRDEYNCGTRGGYTRLLIFTNMITTIPYAPSS